MSIFNWYSGTGNYGDASGMSLEKDYRDITGSGDTESMNRLSGRIDELEDSDKITLWGEDPLEEILGRSGTFELWFEISGSLLRE